jgi:hypothetical protein
MLVLAGAAVVWWAAPPAVMAAPAGGAVAQAGTWRTAIEVPGLGPLNKGGDADVSSVSCGSAGNCSAGGSYLDGPDGPGNYQAFVVSERNGTWRKAIEVPGSGMLNKGGAARVDSVSCASAGTCSAGGTYNDGSGHQQAFVVSEQNGTWRTAIEVPGSGMLNKGGYARVDSVSCASAGNCGAGGFYEDLGNPGHFQAFVVSERNGTWRKAIEVPGSGMLNKGGAAGVTSVSCASAGNCAAGGFYEHSSVSLQAFVVSERNGTWGTARQVPGSGALNAGGSASVKSVSCPSAGNCAAGGYYFDGSWHYQAFVVSEQNGTWLKAVEVPGSGALNTNGDARVESVSCASAGNCVASGSYNAIPPGSGTDQQAFVVSERSGTWRKAIKVPGSGILNRGGQASAESVSCASAGNCAAGGYYNDGSGHQQAFVVSENNGTWRTAIEVPGSGALNTGGCPLRCARGGVSSVSCASAGNCAAGGTYTDSFGRIQAFVVSQA